MSSEKKRKPPALSLQGGPPPAEATNSPDGSGIIPADTSTE